MYRLPHNSIALFSCCSITLLVIISTASGGDWNQWRGPTQTGHLAESPALMTSLPENGLEPVWVSGPISSARDGGWGSPVVSDGLVYLFCHKKELVGDPPGEKKYPWLAPDKRTHLTDEEYAEYEKNRRDEDEARAKAFQFRELIMAFDAISGEERWTNQSESTYTRFPQSGSPTVIDGRLYILGAGRNARCLDAATGEQLWQTKLPGEFRDEFYQASVLVVDEIAIFNATHLFGINIRNGEIVWSGDPQQTKGTHASPVLWQHQGQNYIVSVLAGGKTVCLNPDTGKVLWTTDSEGGHATPIVINDLLLVYGNSRKKGLQCFRMTPAGAYLQWKFQRLTDKGSTPIVAGKHVYIQGERKLACVDLESGSQLWMAQLDMENPQWGSPIAAGDLGIYGYDGLLAFTLTPEEFITRFQANIDEHALLGSTEMFRERYQLDSNDLDAEARKQALKDYQAHVGRHGMLRCSSPALSNGFLYVRLKDRLACYDLRAK